MGLRSCNVFSVRCSKWTAYHFSGLASLWYRFRFCSKFLVDFSVWRRNWSLLALWCTRFVRFGHYLSFPFALPESIVRRAFLSISEIPESRSQSRETDSSETASGSLFLMRGTGIREWVIPGEGFRGHHQIDPINRRFDRIRGGLSLAFESGMRAGTRKGEGGRSRSRRWL
jgi:hypothetical protein